MMITIVIIIIIIITRENGFAYTINLIDTFPNAASNVLKIIFDFFAVRLCTVSESTCSDGKNIVLHIYISVYFRIDFCSRLQRKHRERRPNTHMYIRVHNT